MTFSLRPVRPATVTPASLRHLVLPALGLVAVLVLVVRPLVLVFPPSGPA